MDAIITAAGKNQRMINDFKKQNKIPIHKLKLMINNKPIIVHTIEQVLNSDIEHCTLVLGYYKKEIYDVLKEYNLLNKVSIVINPENDVALSKTIENTLKKVDIDKYYLFAAGDQPTITSSTINKLIYTVLNNDNPENTLSILARREIGRLNSAEGIGMPFCCKGDLLYRYIQEYNGNLNPILRKMISDNVSFYGIKAANELELININHYDEYLTVKKEMEHI